MHWPWPSAGPQEYSGVRDLLRCLGHRAPSAAAATLPPSHHQLSLHSSRVCLEGIQGQFSLTCLKFVLAEVLKAEVLSDLGSVKL